MGVKNMKNSKYKNNQTSKNYIQHFYQQQFSYQPLKILDNILNISRDGQLFKWPNLVTNTCNQQALFYEISESASFRIEKQKWRSREIKRSYFVKEYYSAYVIMTLMFFREELLGGKHHRLQKVTRKNYKLPFKKHGRTDYKAPFKNFGSQIMNESVDKIIQKYIINPFFWIKLDMGKSKQIVGRELLELINEFTTLRNNIEQTHFSPFQQNQKLLKIKSTIDRLKYLLKRYRCQMFVDVRTNQEDEFINIFCV